MVLHSVCAPLSKGRETQILKIQKGGGTWKEDWGWGNQKGGCEDYKIELNLGIEKDMNGKF